jgi:hypothetical protein
MGWLKIVAYALKAQAASWHSAKGKINANEFWAFKPVKLTLKGC